MQEAGSERLPFTPALPLACLNNLPQDGGRPPPRASVCAMSPVVTSTGPAVRVTARSGSVLMRVAKAIAISLVAVLLLVSCASSPTLSGRHDAFFIRDASFADSGYLHRLDALRIDELAVDPAPMGLFAHRLAGGAGTVFALRIYSPGSRFTADDESFEKLTIWLQRPLPAAGDIADDDTALVVHTQGGSAWPDRACSGVLRGGVLKVRPVGNDLDVSISGDLIPAGNLHPQRCAPRRLEAFFRAKELSLDSMTPWLGAAGSHPYAESYPK